MQNINRLNTFIKSNKLAIAAFLLCAAVFVVLRARFVSHLLAWDEAMNLCSVRSFYAGGTDEFSGWFWRHPPIYTLLMTLCVPLKAGFAERVEIMTIVIGVINLTLLFILNRKLFGARAGLWSCLFLALMPGAVFFDVWIKRDHAVTTFGLLSLLLFYSKRHWTAAFVMGLAFLVKLTAMFYLIGALGIAFVTVGSRDGRQRFLAMLIIPALVSVWWYALFGDMGKIFDFTNRPEDHWVRPWFTYFAELPAEIGWQSIIAIALGGTVFLLKLNRLKKWNRLIAKGRKHWALLVLIPSYVLLSLVSSKTTWIIIVLFPAWATLAGVGINAFLEFAMGERQPSRKLPPASIASTHIIIAAVILGFFLIGALKTNYEAEFKKLTPAQWEASSYAKRIVDGANERLADGDRVLLTNFSFWGGVAPGQPCAVFTYYLEPKIQVLMRRHDISADELYSDIKEFDIDWAIVSPNGNKNATKLYHEFQQLSGLKPELISLAMFYDVRFMHE